MNDIRRPPYTPGIATALASLPTPPQASPENIPFIRESAARFVEDLERFDLHRRDFTMAGFRGDALEISVYARPDHDRASTAIFTIHGGAMIAGNRSTGLSLVLPFVAAHDAVVVTVEYRLAPEYPDPYPVEDCYSGLLWMVEHAADVGIDPTRILIAGASAGGGLAAGVALLCRDRGGPQLLGQLLICPMLDDRDESVSTRQFSGIGLHSREDNLLGWTALLGDRRGTADVSIYAAPARSGDLSGLPPTFLDVGSAEVFRDEVVAYASQLWADGGDAELHVWPGGTHGWEALAQDTAMAAEAAAARTEWVARLVTR